LSKLLVPGAPKIIDPTKPEPKAVAPEAIVYLLNLADDTMRVEREAFEGREGTLEDKLKAAHKAEMVTLKALTREEEKRMAVQFAPGLFGKVTVIQIPMSEVTVRCKDVRKGFMWMRANGYQPVPDLGLGPLDMLRQIQEDNLPPAKREERAAHRRRQREEAAKSKPTPQR